LKNPSSKHLVFEEAELDKQELGKLKVGKPGVDKQENKEDKFDLTSSEDDSCGVSYNGPQIPPPPSFLHKVVENEPEATKDTVHPTNNGSTEDVQPQIVQSKSPILTSEPVNSPTIDPVISLVSAPRPNLRPSIPYPSKLQD
nr:reverse transcriptase domain-containing protein [Tanacetum cinerariifolium]